jgi:hypothetical protein
VGTSNSWENCRPVSVYFCFIYQAVLYQEQIVLSPYKRCREFADPGSNQVDEEEVLPEDFPVDEDYNQTEALPMYSMKLNQRQTELPSALPWTVRLA